MAEQVVRKPLSKVDRGRMAADYTRKRISNWVAEYFDTGHGAKIVFWQKYHSFTQPTAKIEEYDFDRVNFEFELFMADPEHAKKIYDRIETVSDIEELHEEEKS